MDFCKSIFIDKMDNLVGCDGLPLHTCAFKEDHDGEKILEGVTEKLVQRQIEDETKEGRERESREKRESEKMSV